MSRSTSALLSHCRAQNRTSTIPSRWIGSMSWDCVAQFPSFHLASIATLMGILILVLAFRAIQRHCFAFVTRLNARYQEGAEKARARCPTKRHLDDFGKFLFIPNLVGVAIAVSRSEGSPLDLDLGQQWVIYMIIGEIYLLGVFVITRWCRRTFPQRSFLGYHVLTILVTMCQWALCRFSSQSLLPTWLLSALSVLTVHEYHAFGGAWTLPWTLPWKRLQGEAASV